MAVQKPRDDFVRDDGVFLDNIKGAIQASDMRDMSASFVSLLSQTPVVTADYTAGRWELVRYDPTGGGFTITLPTTEILPGDRIGFKNLTSSENSVTIDPTPNSIDGDPLPQSVAIPRYGNMLLWTGTEWSVLANNKPAGMLWQGEYQVGVEYNKNDVVIQDMFTMIANKQTTDHAAPQPVGSPAWLLPDAPAWVAQSYSGTVSCGVTVTSRPSIYLLNRYRLWMPDVDVTSEYRIVIRDNITGSLAPGAVFLGTDLAAPGWLEVTSLNTKWLLQDDDITVFLVSKKLSGVTTYEYPYTYIDRDRDGPEIDPGSGNFTYNRDTFYVRLSNLDSGAVDRSTTYDQAVNGTVITITEDADPINWITFEVADGYTKYANHYTFNCFMKAEGGGGRPNGNSPSTMKMEIPVPGAMPYVEITDHFLPNTYLSGELVTTGAGVLNQDAYGIDFEVQEYQTSPDWDFIAYSG